MFRLYDTAKAEIVEVMPRREGEFSMYCCGPTVYDLPHIGHGRAMLSWDLIRRYLEWTGVNVHHVANITDVDDNIINRAAKLGWPWEKVVATYEDEWWKASDALGCHRPIDSPHATAYVDRMVELIVELVRRGFAYDTSDTVYFEATKVDGYGLLARQTIESLQAGARVEADAEKHSPIDFALWKKAAGADDVPQWPSPWGAGRPGWHTECVVMSLDILGEGFDLHGGGLDLQFPHHENERAQAVAWGRPFAEHWVHHGFIEVGGEKMSKSLNNFTSLTDLLSRTDPRAYRLLVYRGHYRAPIDVTPELTAEAESALGRIDALGRRLGGAPATALGRAGARARGIDVVAFDACLASDLDTPGAIALIFDLIRQANSAFDSHREADGRTAGEAALEFAAALGIFARVSDEVDSATQDMVRRMDAARAGKDWPTADALRTELQAAGWTVEQTKAGARVHR